MLEQEQFLQVLDRDEAERRFRAAIDLSPRGMETVPLDAALGRVLAADVVSPVDVPSFDRSNVDGFAVVAEDTFGASEEVPRSVLLGEEQIHPGIVPATVIHPGKAVLIATGGMVPRGADAVVMVEYAEVRGGELRIARAVTAGSGVSFAGTDITAGETVLRQGQPLASRDTGVLAAIGIARVKVWRRPVVAILSTGNEIIAPGEPMQPAKVYDSNAQVLADAVRELGGEPRRLGIAHDDVAALRERLHHALEFADIVLLSGGTSKGAGDVSYRVVAELDDPGIVVHGVALKPGKPICLAATGGRPVVVLPGFPTSAIFTFREFVAPVIRLLAGTGSEERTVVPAKLAVKVNSEIGRTEYLLVGLVETADEGTGTSLAAYPMGQGSGSVTTFSRADGFATIGRHEEIVQAGTIVNVQLLGRDLQLADLVVIGSHCVALLSHVIEPGVCIEKMMLTTNTPALRIFPATPGPHPIALLAHGNGGSKEMLFRFGEAFAAAGFECYSVDLAGYGDSPLPCSLTNIDLNFQEAYRALGAVDVFIGHSLGGGVGGWSVRNAGFHPKLFIGVGAPVKLGEHAPPLLLLGGLFEEFYRPAQLKARTDAQVVISPWCEHILEAYDPVLVRAAVKAARAAVGKPVPAAPTAWRWRFTGLVLGIAGALVLMFRLPELHPRLARTRRFIVPAILLIAVILTMDTWIGVTPQLRRISQQLVLLPVIWLVFAGLRRLRLPRWSLPVVTVILALVCLALRFAYPMNNFVSSTLMCIFGISTLLLLPSMLVGRIATRGGSRRDGDIATAIFASYVIGQFMPLCY